MPETSLLIAFFGGLLLMAVAADLLVRGAVSLARAIGSTPLIAGIFIVGFGTSLPEMLVAVDGVRSGSPGLAFGNIVGSNIANVFLILGIPALIFPVLAGGPGQTRAMIAMLIVTLVWIGLTAIMPLDPVIGLFFFMILIGYTGFSLFAGRRAEVAGEPTGYSEDILKGPPVWRALLYVPAGLAGVVFAATLIISGGAGLARALDIPEYWIGLTLLAVGTSLPEIGAAIAAAIRKRGDIVVGAVVGSNIFNILAAGGLISLFGPVEIAPVFHTYDHWVMGLAAFILALIILLKARIGRLLGLLLLLLYAVYIFGLVNGINLLALAELIA
jgi:cation:H+ antiporter